MSALSVSYLRVYEVAVPGTLSTTFASVVSVISKLSTFVAGESQRSSIACGPGVPVTFFGVGAFGAAQLQSSSKHIAWRMCVYIISCRNCRRFNLGCSLGGRRRGEVQLHHAPRIGA